MPKEKLSYICELCGTSYVHLSDAEDCEKSHKVNFKTELNDIDIIGEIWDFIEDRLCGECSAGGQCGDCIFGRSERPQAYKDKLIQLLKMFPGTAVETDLKALMKEIK
jgi:hypothetical protein